MPPHDEILMNKNHKLAKFLVNPFHFDDFSTLAGSSECQGGVMAGNHPTITIQNDTKWTFRGVIFIIYIYNYSYDS